MKDREKISSRKKNPVLRKIHVNGQNWRFLEKISESTIQISIIFGQKVQNKLCEQQKKTGHRFLFNFRRYLSPKMAPVARSRVALRECSRKKIFSPNDSKWSNSRKKHVSRNSKNFCPYDLTLARHLENFRLKFFRPKKIFFCLTILNGPIREKNMFPEIRKIFALMT